ncbi:hypothetical protein [Mucilaginibacter sp. R-33]|uniref:hypothetical protein n=1 Tax=Mucilaginibacter sp. R-33 TaxID=3416711 RepID=UPI003CFBC30C
MRRGLLFRLGIYLAGVNPAEAIDQQNLYADAHFAKTMGLKLATGRDLMPGDSGKVLINETLAKQLAIRTDKAMGTLLFSEGDHKYEVAGVVRDFNFKSLHNDISPFMIIYASKASEINNLIVNIHIKDYANFLGSVKTVWHKNLPRTPFVYTFMNERMQSTYETDIVLSQIINSLR